MNCYSRRDCSQVRLRSEWYESKHLILPIGYIPGGEALAAVENLAKKLKSARPGITYLLDRT
jgi:hypothetical protein